VRRPPRRARGAREDDAEDVAVDVLADQVGEREQLRSRLRCVPRAHVLRRLAGLRRRDADPLVDVVQLLAQQRQLVIRRLDVDQQAVERRELRAGRVESGLERLHERRPRAGERVEDVPAAREVPVEQHLDELRDELAVVRVQAMHVLRPHVLGERALGPRQLEVQRRVELVLRDGHEDRLR